MRFSTFFSLFLLLFANEITACDPPGDPHAGSQNGISANFFWAIVPDAVVYEARLYRLDYKDTIFRQTNLSPLNIGGLSPFTTYVFSVRAKCSDNIWSGWSQQFIITTGGSGGGGGTPTIETCRTPTNLSAEKKSPTSFKLYWYDVEAAKEYEIEVRDRAGIALFQKKTSVNFIEIDSLQPAQKYEFRVRSICLDELTNWSNFLPFGLAENEKLNFKITPNPTLDNLQIDLSEFQMTAVNVLIFNQLGQKTNDFYFSETHQNSEVLLLENLPSGAYFLKIIAPNSTSSAVKFCVARR